MKADHRGWVSGFTAVFGLIGLLLLAGALISAGASVRRKLTHVSTPGSVIDMVPCSDGGLCPLVLYRAPDGASREITGTVSTSWARYKPEDRVAVLYDPANPSRIYLDDPFDDWFVAALLGFIGAVFTGVAVLARRA